MLYEKSLLNIILKPLPINS